MMGTHDGMIGLNHLWAGGGLSSFRPSSSSISHGSIGHLDVDKPKPQHWSKTLCICEGRPGYAHPGGGPGGKRSPLLVIAGADETGRC